MSQRSCEQAGVERLAPASCATPDGCPRADDVHPGLRSRLRLPLHPGLSVLFDRIGDFADKRGLFRCRTQLQGAPGPGKRLARAAALQR